MTRTTFRSIIVTTHPPPGRDVRLGASPAGSSPWRPRSPGSSTTSRARRSSWGSRLLPGEREGQAGRRQPHHAQLREDSVSQARPRSGQHGQQQEERRREAQESWASRWRSSRGARPLRGGVRREFRRLGSILGKESEADRIIGDVRSGSTPCGQSSPRTR